MSDPFLGEIKLVGYNFCPRGWHETNGALLAISQYTALFSLLGTKFGGDGRTTFGLPDLRGRVPTGDGQGAGLSISYPIGARGGVERVTLTSSQIPSHGHGMTATSHNHEASGVLSGTTVAAGTCSVMTDEPATEHYHYLEEGHTHDLDFTSVNEAGTYEAISYASGYEEICQKEYETAKFFKNGKEPKQCLFQRTQIPFYETTTVTATTEANTVQETTPVAVANPASTCTVSDSSVTGGAFPVTVDPATAGSTTDSEGGGEGHENRQPYLVMRYCIALQGTFPSRN